MFAVASCLYTAASDSCLKQLHTYWLASCLHARLLYILLAGFVKGIERHMLCRRPIGSGHLRSNTSSTSSLYSATTCRGCSASACRG